MIQKIDLSNPVSIEVKDAGFKTDNFKTISFEEKQAGLYIEISDSNFNELGQRMYPDGLIPDDFHKKIALINRLIEELDDIRDIDNKDYKLSKVTYDSKNDRITCDFEEVEEDVDPREFDE